MRFIGTIEAKADAKGRVFLPASFRKTLGETEAAGFVLRRDIFQPCLNLYPESVWNEMLQSLRGRLNPWDRKEQMVFRQFIANAEPVELDANGRFLIPRRYLEMAGITRGVRFIGMGDYVEIWSDGQEMESLLDPESLAREIQERMGGSSPKDENGF